MSILYNGTQINNNNNIWAKSSPPVTVGAYQQFNNNPITNPITITGLVPNQTYNLRFNIITLVSNTVTYTTLIDGTNEYSIGILGSSNLPYEFQSFQQYSGGAFTSNVPLVKGTQYFKTTNNQFANYFTDSVILTPNSPLLTPNS